MPRNRKRTRRTRTGSHSVRPRASGRWAPYDGRAPTGTADAAEPHSPERFVVEEDRRLSSSLLWRLQRSFFEAEGADAWDAGGVPQFLTTNTFVGRAYARVVAGFLDDCRAMDPERRVGGEPVYIIELGAGSGQFAFRFLTALSEIVPQAAQSPDFTYVMTDFTPSNLDAWRGNPRLRPFLDAGRLDFAVFDAADPAPLRLERAGITLGPEQATNPMVVVANYVFDSIPQDVFSVEGGVLSESWVELTSDRPEPDPTDPDLLSRVELGFRPVAFDSRYDDPGIDRLLDHYRDTLPDATFLMPIAALGCIRYFHDLSAGPLLLLVGDRGYEHQDEILQQPASGMAVHGSFSLPVNFHALGRYVRQRGGALYQASGHRASLRVGGFLFGLDKAQCSNTSEAFDAWIDDAGPDDFFQLKKALEPLFDDLTLEQVLALLRFSNWDDRILVQTFPVLWERLESAGETAYPDISSALRRVWAHHYPVRGDVDVAVRIATLLYRIGYHREALDILEQSGRLHGDDPATAYLAGTCHWQLRDPEAALACIDAVLAIEPDHGPARELRIRIRAAKARRGG